MLKKNIYEFGNLTLDTTRRVVKRTDGTILSLPPKAIDILRVLIENGGEIVEKNDLIETVWANTIVEDSNLTQTIYLLRKALGETAGGENYIQTLPKRGYRFIGDIKTTENNGHVAQNEKIVVLPFENRSDDRENDYLAEGLSESLIDALAQIPQLKVIARNSAFKYKNSLRAAKDIVHALDVKYILDGRVTQRGEKTLIRAELVDAEYEIQLWGRTIECRLCDLQEIQTEITANVVRTLGLNLTGAQTARLSKHVTLNDEAYQLYLNGLFLYRQGGVENTRKALEFYDQATELDPDFALAHALKPAIYAFLTEGYMDKSEAFSKARIAAEKAFETGEELPQTHVAAAIIRKWELDLAGAEREYLRAFELNPNNSSAHNNYALLLSARGNDREALKEIELAAQLDPLLPYAFDINKAWILTNAGCYDEALTLLQEVAAQYPDLKLVYQFTGAAFEGKGQYHQAIAANRKILDEKPLCVYAQADIIYNLFKLGQTAEARQIFEKLLTEVEYVSPVKMAAIFEIDGKREEALKILEEGYEKRDSEMHSLKCDYRLKSLHDEPRFQKIMRKMGLTS